MQKKFVITSRNNLTTRIFKLNHNTVKCSYNSKVDTYVKLKEIYNKKMGKIN